MEKSTPEEAKKLIEDAFTKYTANDFDFDSLPLETRLDVEAAFRIIGPNLDFSDSEMAKFRTKNLISIGF